MGVDDEYRRFIQGKGNGNILIQQIFHVDLVVGCVFIIDRTCAGIGTVIPLDLDSGDVGLALAGLSLGQHGLAHLFPGRDRFIFCLVLWQEGGRRGIILYGQVVLGRGEGGK